MRKIDRSPEKEEARQALREKFAKELAPLLLEKEDEPTEEVISETTYKEVDFSAYEGSTELNNRIQDKCKKNEKYIRESKKLIKRFSGVPFTTNGIIDYLMYRNVETEYIVQYFSKKIGDNAKNKELLLDILKNESANFNMLTSFASSGKTFTVNTIFNDYREYRKAKDEEFLIDLCVNGVVEKAVQDKLEAKIKKSLNSKITDYNYKIKNLKRAKAAESKIKAAENACQKEIDDIKRKILIDYYTGEFVRCKKGATSEVAEINEYVANNPTSLIQILVTPNRIQNEQNQEEEQYNFTAIIGQNGKEITFDADTNYSVVIEKLSEILNKIEMNPSKSKINLVIDEAHVLVEQKNFRSDAINKLIQVVARVLEMNGTVIFMTATPECLKCFNFDKIISFIPVEDVKNADRIKVYANSDMNLSMHDYTISVLNHIKNPLTRYNTKEGIRRAKETLETLGYKVETVTADDKQKELFRSIVKKSALIGADKWICSSVIEVGTNIVGVIQEDGSIALIDITPTYVMHDINNCSFDSIEQFFARARYKVSEYALIIPQKESASESIQCVDVLLNREINRVDSYYKKLEEVAAVIVKVSDSKEEAVKNVNKYIESCENTEGQKYNCNCIYFDGETLELKVDMIALWKNVYKAYIQQYYYHPDLLMKKLQELLGIEVELATDCFDKIKTQNVNNSDVVKDIAKEQLESLNKVELEQLEQVVSKEISINDIENKEHKEKIEAILRVKAYAKYLKQAYNLEIRFSKIIEVILSARKEKQVEEFLQSALYVKGNIMYKKEGTSLTIEQDIILKELYETKSDGSIVQRYITDTDIRDISYKIGKKLKKKVKKCKNLPSCDDKGLEYGIGYEETVKLIRYVFSLSDRSTGTETKYQIRRLNTTLKNPKQIGETIETNGAAA